MELHWNIQLITIHMEMVLLSLHMSPYFLVYGKEVILTLNIYFPTLQISQESQGNPRILVQSRIDTLNKSQEER